MKKTVIITAYGTMGDMNPTIELALAIRSRGMKPVLIINSSYKKLAEEHGIEAFFYGPEVNVSEMLNKQPGYMSRKAAPVIVREIFIPLTEDLYRTTLEVIRQTEASAVVAHALSYGAIWAAKDAGIRSVCFYLAPVSFLTPGIFDIYRAPKRSLFKLMFPLYLKKFNKWLKPACESIGKTWDSEVLKDIIYGHDLIIGLWDKEWGLLKESAEDRLRICGFPLKEPVEIRDEGLKRFLENGSAPVVFALGTSAVNVAGNFFDIALKSLDRLNRRGVFFTGSKHLENLPDTVYQIPSAPYSAVFPYASAITHHGGAGTSSEAMRAGKPSVVIPFAHDQFDNAGRIKKSRVGVVLKRSGLSAENLEQAIRKVLGSEEILKASEDIGIRISENGNGADRVAEAVGDCLEPDRGFCV